MKTLTIKQVAQARMRESIRVSEDLLKGGQLRTLEAVARILVESFQRGKKVIFFGNGGSAADAQHFAAEFVGKFHLQRPALAALALTVDTSALTAIGNDLSFDVVFSRQLEALAVSGDVAIGISTSGNSSNVIRALQTARSMGLVTVGLGGADGGLMKDVVRYCICVPSSSVPRIQECHTLLGHILVEIVESALFGRGQSSGLLDAKEPSRPLRPSTVSSHAGHRGGRR